MQNAETVLGVLRERGRKGLPLDELYRQLFNPQLYLLAYGRIYSNHGAMTPGATQETVDGMSLGKIGRSSMRCATSATGSARSSGSTSRRRTGSCARWACLPGRTSWSAKWCACCLRPTTSPGSPAGRTVPARPRLPHRTAARSPIAGPGQHWFIEGDISDCFGSLDHEVMLTILAEKIHDGRFLRLMRNMLTAGYLEDWRWNATLSGVPAGRDRHAPNAMDNLGVGHPPYRVRCRGGVWRRCGRGR